MDWIAMEILAAEENAKRLSHWLNSDAFYYAAGFNYALAFVLEMAVATYVMKNAPHEKLGPVRKKFGVALISAISITNLLALFMLYEAHDMAAVTDTYLLLAVLAFFIMAFMYWVLDFHRVLWRSMKAAREAAS